MLEFTWLWLSELLGFDIELKTWIDHQVTQAGSSVFLYPLS